MASQEEMAMLMSQLLTPQRADALSRAIEEDRARRIRRPGGVPPAVTLSFEQLPIDANARDILPDLMRPNVAKTQTRFTTNLRPNVEGRYDPLGNEILLRPPRARFNDGSSPFPTGQVLAHETGHALQYTHDDAVMAAMGRWKTLHEAQLSGEQRPNTAILRYRYSPNHSFAEAFRQYATDGSNLQASDPDIYNFFRDMLGFEYSREAGRREGLTRLPRQQ